MQIFRRPRILRRCFGLGDLRIDDEGHRHSKIGQSELGLAQELHADRAVVDHFKLIGFLKSASLHLRGGEAAQRNGALQRPAHVFRRDRRAVPEFNVGFEFEHNRHAVRRNLPALGQLAFERVVVKVQRAVGQSLGGETHEAIVDVHCHHIARAVGAGAMQIQRIDGGADGDDQRIGGLRPGGRNGGQRHPGRQSGYSDALEKITTLHAGPPMKKSGPELYATRVPKFIEIKTLI